MALTATVQSVPERTWDEVIVPTLRKRLETESHVLSKRMSIASIGSQDDRYALDSYQSNSAYVSREKAVVSPVSQTPKPSGIPRPSYSHSKTDSSDTYHRSSQSGSFQRARTFSQPQPFDSPPSTSNTPLPQPVRPATNSRANSPMNPTKTSRIPSSRGRAGSTSSYQPSINGSMGRSDSKTTLPRYNGHVAEPSDLWPVDERQPQSSTNSRSTLRTPRSQYSEIVNENAPFSQNSMNSVSSRSAYDRDFVSPRQSTDSEEAPFEHWYRGDVSRNGGVGELRVARKQEMLDIANYGYTLRQASSRTAITPSSRSRSNSRGRDNGYLHARPRAGSVGARESIYIDDDEHARTSAMVFDEQPLTDLDSDGEVSGEMVENEEDQLTPRMNGTSSPSPPLRSNTPTSNRDLSGFRSRIPTPTPKIITEGRAVTPTQAMNRAASEPPAASTSALSTPRKASGSIPASQSQPNASQSNSTKRRGKSPASTTASSKKMKTSKSPARSPPKKNEEYRRSVAQYPNPEGDDIVDAIPSWTQPIPPSGNWDDVVLPVVARKKGLEGHYAQANGSPQPKPPPETIYEPAPGTFGFDYTKTRQPRTDLRPEEIPMDEFGHRKEQPIQQQPYQQRTMALSPPSTSPTGSRSRPESPAPFSHYTAQEKGEVTTTDMIRPPTDQPPQIQPEEEASGGCCKCIIM